ncbi:MAG TPA: hypothetical protein VNX88_09160 [Terriglobales bacterium]|jgi:hypothetical protein|nr:hypothetical protein [Terriglobales bacterium]
MLGKVKISKRKFSLEAVAASLERCAKQLDRITATKKGRLPPSLERDLPTVGWAVRMSGFEIQNGTLDAERAKLIRRVCRLLVQHAQLQAKAGATDVFLRPFTNPKEKLEQ